MRSEGCERGWAWCLLLVAATALALGGGAGCKRSQASTTSAAEPAPPPPTVKDDTAGLLLTWVDDKGDFHVESRVADVPLMGRDAVRVVDPAKDDTAMRDRVFIADLRQLRPDGTYAVRMMSRPDFEAIAVARREKTGPTLGSAASAAAAGSGAAPAEGPHAGDVGGAGQQPGARALVVIYGAEWCGACHEAMRYLRRKGVAYVEKDVEKDPSAAREMQEKLARNGLRGGSIPIIDVRGKVMVGFNPAAIDEALGPAL